MLDDDRMALDELTARVARQEREIAALRARGGLAHGIVAALHPRRRRRAGLAVVVVAAIVAFPMIALAATFSDVPPDNMFYADISAIADAGVTTGCGEGRFCPGDVVTREQMAAFMNRLGALAADKTPVVNADKLDGFDSPDFLTYDAQLPPDRQLTGTFGFSDTGMAGSEIVAEDDVEFSVPLGSPPTVHLIMGGDTVPAGCSGNAAAPNATAGHLCIFVGYTSEADKLDGFYSTSTGLTGQSSTRGVVVFLRDSDGDGFVEGTGTWAVRAPIGVVTSDPQPTSGGKGARPALEKRP